MGVPTFYRWLSSRYPKVVIDVSDRHIFDLIEQKKDEIRKEALNSGKKLSDNINIDISNDDIGYDCLYLDMNGIIHPCCHNDDGDTPTSEDDMFSAIFDYIDRLMAIVQPKKLLYMAIDGVAPRAKLNQQRIRRFKSAKDAEEEEEAYQKLKAEFIAEGRQVPEKKYRWDSNVITPGTPFMDRLARALRYFIQSRIAEHKLWRSLQVIFSDSNVPGEGEHKIVSYIREQRKYSTYPSDLRHVLHGADADLIMLGLATHERNFFILREAVVERVIPCADGSRPDAAANTNNVKTDEKNYVSGLDAGSAAADELLQVELNKRVNWKPLQMIQLPVLREYLEYELTDEGKYDLERVIDDFVFLCFLCGNDFLPHLPYQSIHRGSIDMLVHVYLHLRSSGSTGYLTDAGCVDLVQLAKFMEAFSVIEEQQIKLELERKERNRKRTADEKRRKTVNSDSPTEGKSASHIEQQPQLLNAYKPYSQLSGNVLPSNNAAAASLKEEINRLKTSKQISDTSGRDCDATGLNEGVDTASNERESKHRRLNDVDDSVNNIEDVGNAGVDVSVKDGERKSRQKDIDLFKLILNNKLTSSREIDIATLNTQGFDSGVGCSNRDQCRKIYYREKFFLDNSEDIETFSSIVANEYILGLQWVLFYYYQGCRCFDWYFPFHYAPFTVDMWNALKDLAAYIKFVNKNKRHNEIIQGLCSYSSLNDINGGKVEPKALLEPQDLFCVSRPLKPVEQLMAVLPPYSSFCLPKENAAVMCSPDSPIADFYPSKCKYDPNGKRHQWQWVVLLPFIDKFRLLSVSRSLEYNLTDDEKNRNRLAEAEIFVHTSHPASEQLSTLNALEGRGLRLGEDINWGGLSVGQLPKAVVGNGKNILVDINVKSLDAVVYFNEETPKPGDKVEVELDEFPAITCASWAAYALPPQGRELEKHQSKLLPSDIEYKRVLDICDLEDQDRRDRTFCGAVARRMVVNSLGGNRNIMNNGMGANQSFRNQNQRGGCSRGHNYRPLPQNYNNRGQSYSYRQQYNNPNSHGRQYRGDYIPNYNHTHIPVTHVNMTLPPQLWGLHAIQNQQYANTNYHAAAAAAAAAGAAPQAHLANAAMRIQQELHGGRFNAYNNAPHSHRHSPYNPNDRNRPRITTSENANFHARTNNEDSPPWQQRRENETNNVQCVNLRFMGRR